MTWKSYHKSKYVDSEIMGKTIFFTDLFCENKKLVISKIVAGFLSLFFMSLSTLNFV